MYKKLLSMMLALAMIAGLVACGSGGDHDSTPPNSSPSGEPSASGSMESGEYGDIIFGLNASWGSLCPLLASAKVCQMVNDNLFEPLIVNGTEDLVYRAAKSIDVLDDGLTWVVHLQEGVTWTDGVPCTAEDWVWTLETITNPEIGVYPTTGHYSLMAGTDGTGCRVEGEDLGAVYVDDYTFELHWKNPLSLAAFSGMYCKNYRAWPKHLLEDIPVAELTANEFWSHPVGNGICVFADEPVVGQELVLKARDDGFYLGDPQFNQLVYVVVDSTNAVNALATGEIDTYYMITDADDLASVRETEGIYMQSVNTGTMYALELNNEKYDTKIRQAIDLLIDKNLIVSALCPDNGYAVADNVNPLSPYYLPYESAVDVEGAKALLDEAGWNYNDTITVYCAAPRETLAIMIQQMCAQAGLKIEIQTGDTTAIYADMRSGNIDAVLAGWTMYFTPVLNSTDYKVGAGSMCHVTNPQYTEILEELGFCDDEARKAELMKEWQELNRSDVSSIFIYYITDEIPVADHISGISSGGFNHSWEFVSLPK